MADGTRMKSAIVKFDEGANVRQWQRVTTQDEVGATREYRKERLEEETTECEREVTIASRTNVDLLNEKKQRSIKKHRCIYLYTWYFMHRQQRQ